MKDKFQDGDKVVFKSYRTLRSYIDKNPKFYKDHVHGISWGTIKGFCQTKLQYTVVNAYFNRVNLVEDGLAFVFPEDCFKKVKEDK